jgi:hypothetical protein
MPVAEDATREMFSLFEGGARDGKTSVEVTPLLLLQRIECIGDLWDAEGYRGQLAVCRSVLLTALNVSHGDSILVEQPDAFLVRFVLPRPGPTPPPED